jgi:hypothetical protein
MNSNYCITVSAHIVSYHPEPEGKIAFPFSNDPDTKQLFRRHPDEQHPGRHLPEPQLHAGCLANGCAGCNKLSFLDNAYEI